MRSFICGLKNGLCWLRQLVPRLVDGDQSAISGKSEYGDMSELPRVYGHAAYQTDGCLDYVLPDGLRVRVYLVRDTTSIGRGAGADCTVEDMSVSEKHAEILRRDGEYFIRASDGVTSVNGATVTPGDQPVPIHSGDAIRLADLRMTFLRRSRISDAGSHFPVRTVTTAAESHHADFQRIRAETADVFPAEYG